MAFTNQITSNKLTLIIVFVAFISSKADLVDDVCNRDIHPNVDVNFCETALRSNPAYAIADLWALELLGIGIAQNYTNSTIKTVTNLKKRTTSPELGGIYDACLRNYGTASNELLNCIDALHQKNYEVLNQLAQAANDASVVCDSSFQEPKAPEPRELKTAAMQVQTLYTILGYMASKLEGH